jgi:uncharacterized membrane protein
VTALEVILRAVNLFATGVVTGTTVLFQLSVVPIMRSWSEERSLGLHRDFATVADPDIFIKPAGAISLLSAILVVILGHHHRSAALALTIAGIVAFAGVAIISEAINVPVNRWAAKWSGDAVPAAYGERRHRWERAHLWRTILAVAGFGCYIVGALEAA